MSEFIPHHEWLGDPKSATRLGVVVHGALGSGQNFRSFVKRLLGACPDFAFALVDLRGHGQSHPAPAPHTLAVAAADLERLVQRALADNPHASLHCVIGHSLGGKVALQFARQSQRVARQVWALDSNPGAQDPEEAHEIRAVLAAVRSMAEPIRSRQDVVSHLLAQGLTNGLAQWMTTNLRREGDTFRWVFDFDVIEGLLRDYFAVDLWAFLAEPHPNTQLHLVIAEASNRWTPEMRRRAAAVVRPGQVEIHPLPNAGHWVHVDNPGGLLAMLIPALNA
jgi:esterase